MKYQIYCDRGNGPELDGCWGGENALFDTVSEAETAALQLSGQYPDCEWMVKEVDSPDTTTMKRFNSFVQRFDFLTLFQCDTCSPDYILRWYQANEPLVAAQFEAVGRALGYFQTNH